MANREDLARVRQGVGVWNTWRIESRVRPDLSGANLSGADLVGAHLGWADLRQTNLSGANLGGARLRGGNLFWADLSRTNLNGADLSSADLSSADLRETVFANIDLSATNGLETCIHFGPSILDHRTLQRSGRLPLAFLRGCGLPDQLIDYLPSLLEEAIQYYSCFISYSSKDEVFAKRLSRRPAEQRRALLVRAGGHENR